MYYNLHFINKLSKQNLVKYALTKPKGDNYDIVATIYCL